VRRVCWDCDHSIGILAGIAGKTIKQVTRAFPPAL
jgi:hypothetical protein